MSIYRKINKPSILNKITTSKILRSGGANMVKQIIKLSNNSNNWRYNESKFSQ